MIPDFNTQSQNALRTGMALGNAMVQSDLRKQQAQQNELNNALRLQQAKFAQNSENRALVNFAQQQEAYAMQKQQAEKSRLQAEMIKGATTLFSLPPENRAEAIEYYKERFRGYDSVINSLNELEKMGGEKQNETLLKMLAGYSNDPLSAYKTISEMHGNKDFWKAEMDYARGEVKDFNKQAVELASNYKTLEGLLTKEKINRADVSSSITMLARLISSGVVTDNDFQVLSGTGTLTQEIISLIRGGKNVKDKEFDDVLQKALDPTNPDLFDQKEFFKTVQTVVASKAPVLLSKYDEAQGRAGKTLNSKQMDVNFGSNRHYDFLKGLSHSLSSDLHYKGKPLMHKGVEVTEEDIQSAMIKTGATREDIINSLRLKQGVQ